MRRHLRALVVGNLRDYVTQARKLNTSGDEVYRTMLNLSLAADAYWEHAVEGAKGGAAVLRAAGSDNVGINYEITNGYRHFYTDRGRHVTDHTPARHRDIRMGGGGASVAVVQPQIQLTEGTLNYNVMIDDTLQQIIDHAVKNDWIDPDTQREIRVLLSRLTLD
ncbi:hypothetical protein GCM10008019_44320 [Deinococcus soli (ex Cha et al. 2016)]|nr:hypothetical protein GCM10008019_44320 [Deinococcus soli (ex Cha et al. 2016)]